MTGIASGSATWAERAAADTLVGAVAWTFAFQGGVADVDRAVALALALAALGLARRPALPQLAGVVAMAAALSLPSWLVVAGLLHGTVGDGLRLAGLVVTAAAAMGATSSLCDESRTRLWRGLVTIGTFHAGVALVAAVGRAWSAPTGMSLRAGGLIGYPNALAVFLLVTFLLTLRAWGHAGQRSLVAAAVVQATAVTATGSRLGIAGLAIVVLAAAPLSRRGRLAVGCLVLAGVGAVVGARGFDGEAIRLDLWHQGLDRVAAHPLDGDGPAGPPFAVQVDGIPAEALHVHDEPLQLIVDGGLIGAGLMAVAVAGAWRRLRLRRPVDPALAAAGAALGASALVDVTLRLPAVACTAALIAGGLLTDRQPTGRHPRAARAIAATRPTQYGCRTRRAAQRRSHQPHSQADAKRLPHDLAAGWVRRPG